MKMKKLIEKIKSLDKGTVIRTIALAVTLLNDIAVTVASFCGVHSTVYITISVIATIGTAVIAWWENNDITLFAQLGTKVLNALKDGKITKEEVENLFKKDDQTK